MKSLFRFFFRSPQGPASFLLIRLAVGLIFLTQGILKYIDPKMGVDRFMKIGFPHPYFTSHFVGAFEIVCGLLVLLGLWTRAAAVPLLIVISTAIATTKVPELFRAQPGLLVHGERRADGFRDVVLGAVSTFGERESMVAGRAAPARNHRGRTFMRELPIRTDTGHRHIVLPESRREFLKKSGLAAGAVLLAPIEQFAGTAIAGELRQSAAAANESVSADYTLRIKTSPIEIAAKRILSTTTYNGQFPGPLLRLKEGGR